MKMKLAWHEQCLKNSKRYVDELKKKLADLEREVNTKEQRVTWAEVQITEAKRRGLTEFDPERFMMRGGRPAGPWRPAFSAAAFPDGKSQ